MGTEKTGPAKAAKAAEEAAHPDKPFKAGEYPLPPVDDDATATKEHQDESK